MNLIFLFSLLIIAGMVINQKFVSEAIRKLLVPQAELMPHAVAVVKAERSR